MNRKIVKFRDGSYGIRKKVGLFRRYRFQSLNNPEFWWEAGHHCSQYCKGTLDQVLKVYNKVISENGQVVDLRSLTSISK